MVVKISKFEPKSPSSPSSVLFGLIIAPTVAIFTVLSGSSNVILSPTLNGVSAMTIDSYLPSFLPISLSAFVVNPFVFPFAKPASSIFLGEATITSSPVFSLE